MNSLKRATGKVSMRKYRDDLTSIGITSTSILIPETMKEEFIFAAEKARADYMVELYDEGDLETLAVIARRRATWMFELTDVANDIDLTSSADEVIEFIKLVEEHEQLAYDVLGDFLPSELTKLSARKTVVGALLSVMYKELKSDEQVQADAAPDNG